MRQRPIAVTVFGILNIGYALWKFVGLLMGAVIMRLNLGGNSAVAALGSNPAYIQWTHLSLVVGVVFGIVLIASGVGLLLLQNWARIVAIVYAALEMIFVVASAIFTQRVVTPAIASQFHGPSAGFVEVTVKIGFVMGLLVALAYPILLLIFMTRPNVVEALNSTEPSH